MTRPPLARTLPDLVAEQAQRRPTWPALVTSHAAVTYGELHRLAARLAEGLARLGVQRGTRVALLAPNRAEWVITAVAATRLGATVAAFNTWVKAYELTYLLEHARPAVLVTGARVGRHDLLRPLRAVLPELWTHGAGDWVSERHPTLRAVVVIGDAAPRGAAPWAQLAGGGEPADEDGELALSAADTAFVLYTSGSTARPKAVPLRHYAIVENGFNIGERMGLAETDRVWLGSPLFWSYGAANALPATFTHGATLVLQEQYTPEEAAAAIARERCTAAYLLPTMIHGLAGLPWRERSKLASLRTGLTIGRPDEVRLAAVDLGVSEICNVYGSTETYGNCCVTPHAMPLERRLACQGPPLPGVRIRLRDPGTGELIADGGEGAIEVSGYVTAGYVDDPELTAQAFTSDGWYRTGDVGRLLSDGCLQFVSRTTDMIKTAGINVSPAEVEDFLTHLPDVAEAAVVGAPDPVRGEVVVAFVRSRDGATLTPEEIVEQCRRGTAGFKVPARVVIVDELPRTATGKLSRLTLRQLAAQTAAGPRPPLHPSVPEARG